jgi:hypothetical protein
VRWLSVATMTGQSVWPSTHSARHAQHTHTHTHTHTYIHTYTNKQTNKHRSDATADGSRQWVASGGTEGQVLLWAPGGSNDALRAEGAREVGRTVQSATDVGSPG